MVEANREVETSVKVAEEREVLYNEGATPLFLAIEYAKWAEARDICESDPKQISVWVRSIGTENTTFTWSVWRRLPIHEACRRQAPAWLVTALLSVFPESAYKTTHFGELPLHLAVESGASPEVVNLIMVANWEAIVAPDASGRIPTEILDRDELLMLDEHRVVYESLTRCHDAYTRMQKAAEDEKAALQRKQQAEATSAHKQYQESLKTEQQRQEVILNKVSSLEAEIKMLKSTGTAHDAYTEEYKRDAKMWKEKSQSLEQTVELLTRELTNERDQVKKLDDKLNRREKLLARRNEYIRALSNDLKQISLVHDEELIGSMRAAEESMKEMVNRHHALQQQINGQAKGIRKLLATRGIEMPRQPTLEQEEKVAHTEDHLDTSGAASALAAAAMAALQKPVDTI
eukprot:Nitzschia sp. Nitz4//scaffold79_size90958//50918//52210//NITZ4_005029-RA/size90958-augustus-gene-0.177-mRNA-1//-1//CDS//3329558261//3646//frame0